MIFIPPGSSARMALHPGRSVVNSSETGLACTAASGYGVEMQTPLFKTERLILRPITLSDAPAVQKHFNNWNIIQNLSTAVPWPYPPDGAESFIRAELQKIADGQQNYI